MFFDNILLVYNIFHTINNILISEYLFKVDLFLFLATSHIQKRFPFSSESPQGKYVVELFIGARQQQKFTFHSRIPRKNNQKSEKFSNLNRFLFSVYTIHTSNFNLLSFVEWCNNYCTVNPRHSIQFY
jgi:hypothetical protein